MKISLLVTAMLLLSSGVLFAQEQKTNQKQYILVIRSKADVKASKEVIEANIKHWQEYMGEPG